MSVRGPRHAMLHGNRAWHGVVVEAAMLTGTLQGVLTKRRIERGVVIDQEIQSAQLKGVVHGWWFVREVPACVCLDEAVGCLRNHVAACGLELGRTCMHACPHLQARRPNMPACTVPSQCVYHIESTCAYDLASYAAYAKLLFFFNFLIWSLEKYVIILKDPALICHANA